MFTMTSKKGGRSVLHWQKFVRFCSSTAKSLGFHTGTLPYVDSKKKNENARSQESQSHLVECFLAHAYRGLIEGGAGRPRLLPQISSALSSSMICHCCGGGCPPKKSELVKGFTCSDYRHLMPGSAADNKQDDGFFNGVRGILESSKSRATRVADARNLVVRQREEKSRQFYAHLPNGLRTLRQATLSPDEIEARSDSATVDKFVALFSPVPEDAAGGEAAGLLEANLATAEAESAQLRVQARAVQSKLARRCEDLSSARMENESLRADLAASAAAHHDQIDRTDESEEAILAKAVKTGRKNADETNSKKRRVLTFGTSRLDNDTCHDSITSFDKSTTMSDNADQTATIARFEQQCAEAKDENNVMANAISSNQNTIRDLKNLQGGAATSYMHLTSPDNLPRGTDIKVIRDSVVRELLLVTDKCGRVIGQTNAESQYNLILNHHLGQDSSFCTGMIIDAERSSKSSNKKVKHYKAVITVGNTETKTTFEEFSSRYSGWHHVDLWMSTTIADLSTTSGL